ncbi:FdhF/YdeP family oxidoreductase [Rhabdobacter roseus]|uniref:Molybdopterin-dependent oxidoreductase alpha subunit n=1 Tax=Rhabdobacter roseus TaxID=1655419 RepID=A0A840U1B1_9BACT|nr:FdhF/YdeP family oxidoreductase [Rhabdobacter roseus]MBB5286158.1 molybdopterin-dependent oxidoreductase alpha subunit [Rhabdobacter roseus]
MEETKYPNPENPEKLTGLRLEKPRLVAAGVKAVAVSLRHIVEEAGVVRGNQALLKLNQKGGFDCPSCAWPDPDGHRSPVAEYCENGAKAVAEEATERSIGLDFFAEHSVFELAELSDLEIGKKGRLAHPMYLPKGSSYYQPISWEGAFAKLAQHLNALDSPDEAVFYTSGRTSNEAAFLYQLFVREYGTNNLPDCSNLCHESTSVALSEALGIGKGSIKLEDLYEAEVIMIMGQNPGTNHPRMLTALQKAKRNGATIISVNPLQEAGLLGFNNPQTVRGVLNLDHQLTDIFLQVRPNGDLALLQALAKLLLQAEAKAPGSVLDQEFIRNKTAGYEGYLEHLQRQNLAPLAEQSGVPLPKIHQAADVLARKKKIIICWAMGLTQHANAVDTIREVVNLLLLKGSIGKPGAGTCPVRGHSNVQGDRTVGIWEKVRPEWRENIRKVYGFEVPERHGYDVVNAIRAMHAGRAKVFLAMGGNFLSATPDTLYTAQALRQCRLTVHVSTKLNRSHLVHGEEALILPTLGRSDRDLTGGAEQFVSCENSTGVVQASRGVLTPVSDQLLSEVAIVCRLAQATLAHRTKVDWTLYEQHYDHIRNDIARVIPGFENYNEKVRRPAGFYLPNPAREGTFNTPAGKALFHVAEAHAPAPAPGEYLLMTLRSHDQFNTTIYGLDDRYRGVHNERRVVFMNIQNILEDGLQSGEVVDLYNTHGGRERVARTFVVVAYDIPYGYLATYFPEANVLVPIDTTARGSNTPVFKTVAVKVQKVIS